MGQEIFSHTDLQDAVTEIGRLFGLISMQEFSVFRYKLDVVWKKQLDSTPFAVFEISLKGDLPHALARLKNAWEKFGVPYLFLVVESKSVKIARATIQTAFQEIADVIKIKRCEDIVKFRDLSIGFFDTIKDFFPRQPRFRFRKIDNME
jgi:hypothetical protein